MSTLADLEAAAPSTQILVEGYGYEINDQGVDASIRFWITGADLQDFVTTVAGLPATTVVIGGVSTPRLIPLLHPYVANCYAYAMRVYPPEGSAATYDGTAIEFPDYFADVRFKTPEFSYTGGDYPTVTISRDSGVEMVTRQGTAYKFPSDSRRLAHQVGVPVATTQYALTFHRLPALDHSTYDSLIGCVNSSVFFGRPIGTMLYLGCSSTGTYTLGGIPSYEATQQFSYRRIPHNQIMRDDGTAFEAPVDFASGDFLLPVADLNALYA